METINITCHAHLTENHQLKAADALIAKLKYQIGQDRSYIEELEDTIKSLKSEICDLQNGETIKSLTDQIESLTFERNNWKDLYSMMNNKYSQLKQDGLNQDEIYSKCIKKVNEALERCKAVQKSNKLYVEEIIKLRNERNNQEVVSN